MKKIILLSLILTFLACDKTGEKVNGFEISGFIDNAKDGTVIYIKYDSLLSSIDSTSIKDEKFRFNGNVREPTRAILYLEGGLLSDGFWIENTKINIKSKKDSLNKTIIDGGREQTMANLYYSLNRKALNKRDSLEHFYVTNRNKIGKTEKDLISEKSNEIMSELEKNSKLFIKQNPNTYESAFILNSKKFRWNKKLVQELFLLMDNRTQNTYYGELVSRYLKLNLNPQIGNKYVDFEQQNLNGEIVKFSEVKGQYTLIEFWASWCGPCRKSYPELKEIYRVYKNRGFEIVGVSIDQNEENWQKAIKHDGLPWVNLTDFMVNDNEAVIIYNVNSVPDNILIDNQGTIIGRDLDNKALIKKLEAIFKKNP